MTHIQGIAMNHIRIQRYVYTYTRYLRRLRLTVRVWIAVMPYWSIPRYGIQFERCGVGVLYGQYRAWVGYRRIA